jgi:flavin-dependent dehydrogenase
MSANHYDVVIIGGRCAGASLALHLADHNLKILLLDRATFPSLPNVPSAPFIHPAAMRLMDELGINEVEYTHPGSKIEYFVVEMVNHFHAVMPTSQMSLDRNYFRGIDRSLFDKTLWNHAGQVSGVTAREHFAVTQLTKDDSGSVNGIIGRTGESEEETFTADLVVGADGRFSFTARQVGAKVMREENKFTTAVYHAEWENVEDYSAQYPNAIISYRTGAGFMILVVPIAERRYHIGTIMKSADANFGERGFEQAYLQDVERISHLWERLKNARRVTDIVGMRPIENAYREAYGVNWVLVGDAVHYKDPSDGQGIYDALLGSKILAQSIIDWKASGTTWRAAAALYQQRLLDATYPTFKQTVANVKQSIYTDVPDFLTDTLARWMITSPDFQVAFLRYLSRAIEASDYRPIPRNLSNIIMKGFMADIRQRFNRFQ